MSRYMLCDDATINDINPFVVHDFSLPGGVRQTPEFADHTIDVVGKKKEYEDTLLLSPICEMAATMGDRTVDFCTGGREPACPLGRALHPRRNIDYGFTRDAPAKAVVQEQRVVQSTNTGVLGFVTFMILFALVVSTLRR